MNTYMQAETVRREIEALKASIPELEDDPEFLADIVEGETGLHPLMTRLVAKDRDARSFAEAIKGQIDAMKARRARFQRQSEVIRTLMQRLLEVAGGREIKLPEATISINRVAPSVIVQDETAIPDDYATFKRSIDKGSIKAALQDGARIPGASLSNGGSTIVIRYT